MMKCFLTKILAIVAISLSVSGCIITSGSGTEEEKGIVGCWKLETFAGFQADTDVYIVFNADNSFTLYQREDGINYTTASDEYLSSLPDIFASNALICEKAGFDGVDIKCCHGYLFSELLSAFDRSGIYGGCLENKVISAKRQDYGRFKYVIEVDLPQLSGVYIKKAKKQTTATKKVVK